MRRSIVKSRHAGLSLVSRLTSVCGCLAVAGAAAMAAAPQSFASQPTAPPSRPVTPPKVPGSPLQRPTEKTGDQLVRMTMSADVARVQPGKKFLLAFAFEIEPGWHIYWENAGSSGGPTEIEVKVPHGFTVGKTLFPRPQTIPTSDGPCYGYEKQTVLFVEVTPPDTALAQVGFSAEASWLVCKETCKVGSAKSMLTLPFGTATLPSATPVEISPAVAAFKSRLPKELATLSGGSVSFDGKELTVVLPAGKHVETELFPNPTPGVTFGEPRVEVNGTMLHTIVPVAVDANNALGHQMHIAGVIGLGRGPDDPCFSFDMPLTDDGRPQPN